MKFNKISMVLAALAFVGCSSEDLNEFSATPAVEDSNLIQLGSDFVLAGVGAEGTTTRTHWEQITTPDGKKPLVNKFLPIWKTAPAGGTTIDVDANLQAQAVGLCWLGNGATGTNVYTNYEFYHYGWLKYGADEAKFDCGDLTNGALYNEINVASGDAAGAEADTTKFTLAVPKSFALTDLNYNSGVYKTENKAIFGGQYIVYYPYNENFKDAGTIPATALTKWDNVPTDMKSPVLGHETFRYSAPTTIEGGNQAANFGLENLSALVQLRVAAAKGYSGSTKFDRIVLFSAKKQLLKQANLAADKIAAGKEGAELYAETEGTKTIVATFGTPQNLVATDAATVPSAFITALPTTVEDLVVFVHSNNLNKWAKVSLPNTVFKPHSGKRLDITVADADFKSDFIAVDEATLTQAVTDAATAAAATTPATPQTIQVIGDITIGENVTGTYYYSIINNDITITGDDIIVPEDKILSLNTKMESNVRVLGKSCCDGTTGGRLEVYGGTISNVTMEETEASTKNATTNPELDYYGNATVAAGKTVDVQAGNVKVYWAVQHKGDIKIAKDAKLTVYGTTGDLNFMGSNVTNNGTIEVKKDGKFDMTDANGNATATDGQRMTNNGKFIHNVDAGVGTAVQSMNQNGEYRCKVDDQIKLDDAFLQWTACSVIEMVNTTAENYNLGTAASITPTAYKHNGNFIDIEVNSGAKTTFNQTLSSGNGDGKEIQIGNLTVVAGGLDIVYGVAANKSGARKLTVNGDMAVKANTTLTSSNKINVKKNLTVEGAGVTLTYKGAKANGGLAVTKDIKVSGGTFDAGSLAADVNALNITCANFYLEKAATATFGNRTDGGAKNLVVGGTISNPAGCTFNIVAANQDGAGSVLAWVTCTKLEVGGTFSAARPRVVAAE